MQEYFDTLWFSYDSKNRISRFEYGNDNDYMLITYNSDDKMIKAESSSDGMYLHLIWEGDSVTSQWYYPNYRDVLEPDNAKDVTHFNNKNEFTRRDSYYNYGEDEEEIWLKTGYILYTWADGNITKMEIFRIAPSGKSYTGEMPDNPGEIFREKKIREIPDIVFNKESDEGVLNYTYTYTYDNMKNPLSVHEALRIYFSSHDFKSKNNVVTWTLVNETSGESASETYTYVYNGDGYPLSRIYTLDYENDEGWMEKGWDYIYSE
ncbi:MAG TPA: hypothetical protein ENO01_03505 [Candidatus Marinimicrobia bacterium]|nr:hypothetical protein [Candidatus Neomarinimicrobiota bacterium]